MPGKERLSFAQHRGGLPGFRPRAPWWGGDLQTLRNYLRRPFYDLAPWPLRQLHIPMPDGDQLVCWLHEPLSLNASSPSKGGGEKPLLLLLHGLTGNADSPYLRQTARLSLLQGYPVLRINLRGAGPSRAYCRGMYHAGRSADLAALCAFLPRLLPDLVRRGLIAVGYSLGGNILLKFMGEHAQACPLLAGAAISAPIDLQMTSARIHHWRNRPYHQHLLRLMCQETDHPQANLSPKQRRILPHLPSIYAYDEEILAPRNGFESANAYYQAASAGPFIGKISIPTLILQAQDDPWIPFAAYAALPWHSYPMIETFFPKYGGHVGFHGKGGSWLDSVLAGFWPRALQHTQGAHTQGVQVWGAQV
jgi:uncharacterized protein